MSQSAIPAYITSLIRHFEDLRDGTHGGSTARKDKEAHFEKAVQLLARAYCVKCQDILDSRCQDILDTFRGRARDRVWERAGARGPFPLSAGATR